VGAVANRTPNVDGTLAATHMQPGKEIEENASIEALNPASTLAEPAQPLKAKESVKPDICQTPIRDLPSAEQHKIASRALNVRNLSIQSCLRKKNILFLFFPLSFLRKESSDSPSLGTLGPRLSPRTDLVGTFVSACRS
jgi:hypothetical protein